MRIDMNSTKPIYTQIAEGIEDDILNGLLNENGRAYSQYQVAKAYNINPATAGKGIKLLEQEDILYKKRGMGMFVNEGAKQMILEKRRKIFISNTVFDMLLEAKKLGISKNDIKEIIDEIQEVE